ncbi:hypothetical protein RchiOBHm_Chr1g0381381 [Rosa chinensis]|uniref:Uncharacterized protein n=1 Tax=Rosa chinensis TaxID=74649 RepID=A0A2P6QTN9_ROSCH|nr:hypothetical protein RchiOBHm_Chr4g0403831 [Rosa chinensis]PRQ60454.1 hypothetical protein RchiOBHm_Chr1g0381381 [Rosa chinensis]
MHHSKYHAQHHWLQQSVQPLGEKEFVIAVALFLHEMSRCHNSKICHSFSNVSSQLV